MGDRFSDLTGVLGDAFTISPGKATIDSSAIAAPYTLKLPAAPGAVGESLAISAIAGSDVSLDFVEASASDSIVPYFRSLLLRASEMTGSTQSTPVFPVNTNNLAVSLIRFRLLTPFNSPVEVDWATQTNEVMQTWDLATWGAGTYDLCPDFVNSAYVNGSDHFRFIFRYPDGAPTEGRCGMEIWGFDRVLGQDLLPRS